VHNASPAPGFILLNDALNPVAFNAAALQILSYPTDPGKIRQPSLFVRDKVKLALLHTNGHTTPGFVREFMSGRRKYACQAFKCDCQIRGEEPLSTVLLLERWSHGTNGLTGLVEQFGLSPREVQTVGLLVAGLTTKQIATRMNISANTVKAFLRIVMFKMDVSTRSGIVGKIVGSLAVDEEGEP
jgi:DNA-binding CsgD family transcriptional regulator